MTYLEWTSVLQKYRLGKSQQSLESCADGSSNNDDDGNKQEVEGFPGSEDYERSSIVLYFSSDTHVNAVIISLQKIEKFKAQANIWARKWGTHRFKPVQSISNY